MVLMYIKVSAVMSKGVQRSARHFTVGGYFACVCFGSVLSLV